MRLLPLLTLALFARPVVAQDAAITRFRELIEDVPHLPVDRVALDVDPAVTLEGVSAVSVDSHSNIHVLHRPATGDPVVVLNPDGRFLRSWGAGMYTIPHGIRVDPNDDVWTVDSNTSRVYKFSPEGDLLLDIKVEVPEGGGQFCGTADIAFGGDGQVYVADGYCNGRVIEFDATGGRMGEWGSRGTDPGQFTVVHSVAVGPQGLVYVADRENGRLQRFDRDGRFLGLWTYAGQLFSVAFSPSGELYISVSLGGDPREGYVIQVDQTTGAMLGRIDVFGHEIAFAPDGSLLPATVADEVLLFRPQG
jgi:DNA-binding beta-propeller fold protein YncE